MFGQQFNSTAELEELTNGLARASRHPVFVDHSQVYEDGEEHEVNDPSSLESQDDLHLIYNNRDERRAYVGSKRYNLIQHREVLDTIREAVGNTVGEIEKGVIRDYGEHVNGVIVLDSDKSFVDVEDLVGDGYIPPEGADWTRDRLGLGMRFWNSFDGRSKFGGTVMGYRYICRNWMVWGEEVIAEKEDYHIKSQDSDVGIDPDYFEEVIGEVFERREMLSDVVKDAEEEGEFPLSWVPYQLERVGFGSQYQKQIVYRLLEFDTQSTQTTTWRLYNAVTTHLDHDRAANLGPEPYDIKQESAWKLLTSKPVAPPEDEVPNLREFAQRPR